MNATGSRLMPPRMKFERSFSGSAVASMSGSRRNSSTNIAVTSRRARNTLNGQVDFELVGYLLCARAEAGRWE